MTWFKVDDSFYDHPKVLELSLNARGLWVTAGAYVSRHLTDGRVPNAVVAAAGRGTNAAARQLVEVGLWDKVDGGYQFHDWAEYQPSRADVEAERAKGRERLQRWRDKKRNGVSNGVTQRVTPTVTQRVSNGNPDPSRPVPTISLLTSHETEPDSHTAERELSNDAKTAQHILGCPDDDPRLDRIDDLIAAHQPRSPRAWLRSVAANGDLDQLIEQATQPAEPNPWADIPEVDPNDWSDLDD